MLGQGGTAFVYEGIARDGRRVALKFLKDSLVEDEGFIKRFLREARISTRLNHPHIIKVFEATTDARSRPVLVMELLQGQTLRDLMATRGVDRPTAVHILYQVLAGIGEAHRLDILHRDIKPANIFIESEGVVKVVDFGIATAVGESRLTATDTMIGTPHYMSPEQIDGRGRIDRRTDIYSIGVVLYEMLCGHPPFDGEPMAVCYAHVHQPPPVLPGVESPLMAIVLKALAKRPEDRFQSCDEMADALMRLQGGVTGSVPTLSRRVQTATRTALRGGTPIHPVRFFFLGAALLAGILAWSATTGGKPAWGVIALVSGLIAMEPWKMGKPVSDRLVWLEAAGATLAGLGLVAALVPGPAKAVRPPESPVVEVRSSEPSDAVKVQERINRLDTKLGSLRADIAIFQSKGDSQSRKLVNASLQSVEDVLAPLVSEKASSPQRFTPLQQAWISCAECFVALCKNKDYTENLDRFESELKAAEKSDSKAVLQQDFDFFKAALEGHQNLGL